MEEILIIIRFVEDEFECPIVFSSYLVRAKNLGGKTVEVTVQDACQSCGDSDLDMSPAAFDRLADPSVGKYIVYFSLKLMIVGFQSLGILYLE